MALTIDDLKTEHSFQGTWITDKTIPYDRKKSPVPLCVRKTFTLKKKLRRAILYATAVGSYYVTVNGEKITAEMLAPGYTSYAKYLQYQAYDVTEQLNAENELYAVVSGGWAVGLFGFIGAARNYAPRQLFRCDLVLEYTDGSADIIATDRNWSVSTQGAYRVAGIYEGVHYDARIAPGNTPWKPADEASWRCNPKLRCTYGVLAYRQEHLHPIAQHPSRRGGTIYDFGQNCSAVVCMKIKNAASGQCIRVRHAEVLVDGEIFTSNLRKAEASITYICREGDQEFTPELTTMGFRYARVQGIDPEDLEITAQVVSSLGAPTGGFSCSNQLLNQLQRNIQWGARSNFVDIPTDCPQRDERMGWTGDIAVFSSTACFNFDTARFFDKWLLDIMADQGPGGGIPLVVPAGKLPVPRFATAGWGDCASLVPWAQYWKSGDKKLIARQYDSIKKLLSAEKFWASFCSIGKRRYIWKMPFQFGDWLSPGENARQWRSKGPWIATAYFYNTAHIAAELAKILGKIEDEGNFRKLMVKIENAYRDVFLNNDGLLREEFQTAYILPIHFGMFTSEERSKMGGRLARMAEENDYKISTGFLGTPYLLFALSDTGHTDTAFRVLLNQECPGWLYAVKSGATTIWERWDALLPDGSVNLSSDQANGGAASSADFDPEDQSAPSMTSFNHYAYGAVGDWLYRRIAGLEALEPGWKRFRVNPHPGGGLTWAQAHTQTPYGTARAHWKIEGTAFELTVEVPGGTSCEALLPDGTEDILTEGTHVLRCKYRASYADKAAAPAMK